MISQIDIINGQCQEPQFLQFVNDKYDNVNKQFITMR